MKLRYILTLLLLAGHHFITAQQFQVYQYFDLSDLRCGGKYITGNLSFYSIDSTYSRSGFNEGNRFFLEIAAVDSKEYHLLKEEGRPDRGMSGRARFELPDTLVVGKKYKLRMSSNSPRFVAEEPSYFVYAPDLRPFSVKFGQEVVMQGELSAELKVKIKMEETLYDTAYEVYPFQILLSDGSRSFKYQARYANDFSITVTPTDSLTVYRISEITTGSCGVKGKVEGEAMVKKKSYIERINIRPVSGVAEICRDVPLGLVVDTRIPQDAAGYRVEFSLVTGSGNPYIIDNQVPDADHVLKVNVPKELESSSYVYCRVVHKKTQISSEWLYLPRASKISETKNYLNAAGIDSMVINFFPSSNENFSYARITSITVNGRELRQGWELDGTGWRFPLPQRDTSFVITAINSSCGSVPFSPGKIDFKKDRSVSYTFTTAKTEFCEGEEAEIGYTLSDPARLGNLVPLASLGVSGYAYDPVTGAPTSTFVSIPSLQLPVKINAERNTLSVQIPENLYEELTRNIVDKKGFYISNITLLVAWLSKEPSFTRFGSDVYRPVKLRPDLKLTASGMNSAPGWAEIPVQFRGGLLQYELSNGHKGEVRQSSGINCGNCGPVMAGHTWIGVPAGEDVALRITSVVNTCGTGTFSGETRLQVNKMAPYLSINETLVASEVCSGVAFRVPFSCGNLNGAEVMVKTVAGTLRKLTEEEIRSGSFQLTLTNESEAYEQSFWLEAGSRSSNRVKVMLVTKPQFADFNPARKYVSYLEGDTEVFQMQKYSDINPYFYAYHRLNSFEINGVHYPPDYSYSGFSELRLSAVNQAPLYTFNSVSNACGTLHINKKFRVVEKNTLLNVADVTAQSFIPQQPLCNGSLRLYEISYLGIPPVEDHLTFEVALFPDSDSALLKFFEIPFQKEGNKLRVEVPETLIGNYYFRVKSAGTGTYSEWGLFGVFKARPEVKLVSATGNSEVTGAPGAILKLESNFGETGGFFVRMNTGEVLSSQDFGIYSTYSNDPKTNELIRTTQNHGRSFSPVQTTTYRVESVFNSCGQGKTSGSVKVVVSPYVQLNYSDPSLPGEAFCAGEESALSLTYTEGFPKDTLLGLYLHNASREQDYRELTTFKDLKDRISFRLPEDLEQGTYFLQVRKRSRAAVNSGLYIRDSLAITHFDSPALSLTLITPPRVQLSGSTEIFSGGSADLLLTSLDKAGEHKGYSLDGVTNYITLSNGHSFSLTNTYVSVSPRATETFSVKSVKNVCGTGVGSGEATVVVYPRAGKRTETLGFLRSWPEFNEWYYQTDLSLCAGEKDSLDVNLYGWKENEAPGSFRVVLSEGKKGSTYLPVTVFRSQEVFFSPSPGGARKLRLWFEIPDTIKEGDSYRIKAVSDEDPEIPAVPPLQPGSLRERPTATLSGGVLTQAGGQVEVPVKFTGTAPWFFTVTDNAERIIFNNFPTAADSSLREYRFTPHYSDEYLLKLKADKPAEYKVSRVYNWACGYGKTEGVFRVELILANEDISPVEVSLYPNPVHDQLHLDLSRLNASVKVEVFDLQGRRHATETFRENYLLKKQVLDLRRLQPGTYLVKITSGNAQQTKKIHKL